ncbi:MAG TPA: DUF2378 family protein [Anaeromyxobacteraceae bacterium]|nr:DUF2378 family protein [Anaeromyxobacteraceae bacterium]
MARIKGTAMMNAVKFIRGNFKEKARQILPPELHKYLDARILPSSWYPEEENLALIRALARLLRENVPDVGDDVYAVMGRTVAQADLSGIYANLVRAGDPQETLRRAQVGWRLYHDTGSFQVDLQGPGRARVELSDYGLPSSEMCALLKAFHEQMMVMAGAQEVSSEEISCRSRGGRTCVWEMRWKA